MPLHTLCTSLHISARVSTQLYTISLHISARPCSSRLISRPVKVDVAAQGRLRGDRLEPHRRLLLPDANLADQIMRDRRVARLLAAAPVGPHRVRKPDAAVAVEAPAGPTPCRKGAGAHPRGLVRRDGRVAVVAREEDAVAVEAGQVALRDSCALGPLQEDGAVPLQRPVAAARHSMRVEVGAEGVPQGEAAHGQADGRPGLCSDVGEEGAGGGGFPHLRLRGGGARSARVEVVVEPARREVVEELLSAVHLLEHILDVPLACARHALAALPARRRVKLQGVIRPVETRHPPPLREPAAAAAPRHNLRADAARRVVPSPRQHEAVGRHVGLGAARPAVRLAVPALPARRPVRAPVAGRPGDRIGQVVLAVAADADAEGAPVALPVLRSRVLRPLDAGPVSARRHRLERVAAPGRLDPLAARRQRHPPLDVVPAAHALLRARQPVARQLGVAVRIPRPDRPAAVATQPDDLLRQAEGRDVGDPGVLAVDKSARHASLRLRRPREGVPLNAIAHLLEPGHCPVVIRKAAHVQSRSGCLAGRGATSHAEELDGPAVLARHRAAKDQTGALPHHPVAGADPVRLPRRRRDGESPGARQRGPLALVVLDGQVDVLRGEGDRASHAMDSRPEHDGRVPAPACCGRSGLEGLERLVAAARRVVAADSSVDEDAASRRRKRGRHVLIHGKRPGEAARLELQRVKEGHE
mmetsp:Transcript_32498/g.107263  ORF Transcript_32498/g.107263 Transcript_32498/m.107263 type:complete len:700 (-) Transcript_32498:192-2291(-)